MEKGYKQDKIFWRNFDTQFKKGIKEFEAEISQKIRIFEAHFEKNLRNLRLSKKAR